MNQNKYVTMDEHKLLMPIQGETNEAMKSIMNAYAEIYSVSRIWEPETTEIVKNILKKGSIAIDIGASIGYFTLLLARQVGKNGKVFSFEPTPNQFPYLCENIRVNGYKDRVKAFNVGAWDKKEKVGLPLMNKTFECDTVVVDDVLEAEGVIDKIDFIKIDVDGAEPNVLRGLIRTFEKNKNLKMIFEYFPAYIMETNGSPTETMDIINKYFNYIIVDSDSGESSSEETYWNLYCQHK